MRVGPAASDFIWATGIEDTFVPQTRLGHRALDEYQLMGHYEHWREDLALARDLGVAAVRWGVPWYRVEPLPGEFDWHWTDQVIPYLVEELGITPIIDLMHYGCPFWLRREFVAATTTRGPSPPMPPPSPGATAGLVRWYTPLNEPIVNALMCGRRGVWPPYLRGETRLHAGDAATGQGHPAHGGGDQGGTNRTPSWSTSMRPGWRRAGRAGPSAAGRRGPAPRLPRLRSADRPGDARSSALFLAAAPWRLARRSGRHRAARRSRSTCSASTSTRSGLPSRCTSTRAGAWPTGRWRRRARGSPS